MEKLKLPQDISWVPPPPPEWVKLRDDDGPKKLPYLTEESYRSLCEDQVFKFEQRILDRERYQSSPLCRRYRPGPLETPGARYWPWKSVEARIEEELLLRHGRKFQMSSVRGCKPIPLPPQNPARRYLQQGPYGRTRFPLYISGPCERIVCQQIVEPPKCVVPMLVDDVCAVEPEVTYANFANALLTMSHRIAK